MAGCAPGGGDEVEEGTGTRWQGARLEEGMRWRSGARSAEDPRAAREQMVVMARLDQEEDGHIKGVQI